MDEQEWLSSNDPVRMLRHLLGHLDTLPGGSALPRKVSPRKLRLFAFAGILEVRA